MAYPDDPPVPARAFDYHDPADLSAMYQWAGSAGRLAAWLRTQGIHVAESTINNWLRRYGVPTANPAYAARRNARPVVVGTPTPAKPCELRQMETEEDHSLDRLLEWLERRTVPTCPPPSPSQGGRQYATALVASDLHFPYHHRSAFQVFLRLAATIRPDELVLAGDVFDWPQISKYLSKPSENRPLQDDLDACRAEILAPINAAAPQATKRLLLGNHEHGRWQKYLWERVPALASLRALDLEALLGLAEMGWHYQEHEWWPTDSLCITHGWRHTNQLGGGSAASARKQFLDMGCSGASGHTHRLGSYFRQDRSGYYTWVEMGCLCDWRAMQAAGITSSSTPTRPEDWHLGCLRLHYHPGGSAFRLELLPILTDGDHTFCIVDGEEVSA